MTHAYLMTRGNENRIIQFAFVGPNDCSILSYRRGKNRIRGRVQGSNMDGFTWLVALILRAYMKYPIPSPPRVCAHPRWKALVTLDAINNKRIYAEVKEGKAREDRAPHGRDAGQPAGDAIGSDRLKGEEEEVHGKNNIRVQIEESGKGERQRFIIDVDGGCRYCCWLLPFPFFPSVGVLHCKTEYKSGFRDHICVYLFGTIDVKSKLMDAWWI